MTLDPRLERALPTVLADLGSGGTPAYTERLLERTAHTRQRPAWVFIERWFFIDVPVVRSPFIPTRWRVLAVAMLLIIALIAVAIMAGVGSGPRLPFPFGIALNGTISFSADGDIFAADTLTGVRTPIIDGPEYDFRAGYSPDGTKIGFLRGIDATANGPADIIVARTDGTGQLVITDVPLDEPPTTWGWAPDSRSVVLIMGGAEPNYVIFDATRRGPAVIVDTGGLTIESPVFQPPDGRHVMFRGVSGMSVGLFVMDEDGSNRHAVIPPHENAADDLHGSVWSPDGRQIAYQDASESGATSQIFVMNADGSGAHAIGGTEGAFWDGLPTWSPDGTRLAFGRYDPASNTYRAAILGLDDGVVRTIGPEIGGDVNSSGYWSPDGKSFLIVFGADMGRNPILLDPNGGPDREITWAAETPIDWQRLGS